MSDNKKVEVFQDLFLEAQPQILPELRRQLILAAKAPWLHCVEAESDARASLGSNTDFMVFQHTQTDDLADAKLWIFADVKHYKVTNIVPTKVGELGIGQYNALLQDFARSVAKLAADKVGANLRVTGTEEGGEDWFKPDVLAKLERFSGAANKSSAAGHPLDRERWMAFIIAAHRSEPAPTTDHVKRWLMEIGNWPDEVAWSLTIEYESALELLTEYDKYR